LAFYFHILTTIHGQNHIKFLDIVYWVQTCHVCPFFTCFYESSDYKLTRWRSVTYHKTCTFRNLTTHAVTVCCNIYCSTWNDRM